MKIGDLDIKAFKVGDDDCSIYLGDVKLFPSGSTPTLQWVTFTNELPSQDDLFEIHGIRFNSLDLDISGGYIYIYNDETQTEATFEGGGRGAAIFNTWDGCFETSSSGEDLEYIFTDGYTDECDNNTQPPYYLDTQASTALEYMSYQLLINV